MRLLTIDKYVLQEIQWVRSVADFSTRISRSVADVINPIHSYWWLLLFPAAAMSLTLVALNFLGDALRDALDPRARR